MVRASATCVHHAAWDHLHNMGVRVSTDQEPYQVLSSLLNDEKREGGKQQSLHRLRKELSTKEEKKADRAAKRQRVQRLMREMRNCRMVQRMRDSSGAYLTNKCNMAALIAEFWTGVMSPNGVTLEECSRYLDSLPIPAKVHAAFLLLWKPLSEPLVQQALEKMKAHSSPGLDSAPASVYKRFADMFVTRMLSILESALESGTVSQSWSETILTCIPKSITTKMAAEQRLLAP